MYSQTRGAATMGRRWTLDASSVGWCTEGLGTSGTLLKLQEKSKLPNYPRTTELPFIHLSSLSLFLFPSPATEELDSPRITTCFYTFTLPEGITTHFPE